jgi:hypothetical protein
MEDSIQSEFIAKLFAQVIDESGLIDASPGFKSGREMLPAGGGI